MEENPVLVLFDRRGHFEERKHHGGGLSPDQGSVGQCVGTERMMQDIRSARQEEPCGMRKEGRGRCAVAVEVIFHRLDVVFASTAGTVQVFIHGLQGRRPSGRYDKPGLVPCGHDFGRDDDPPRLLPRGRGRGALLIEVGPGGRLFPIGPCESRPLLEQGTGLLHHGCRLPQEHGLAREAKDKVHLTPMRDDLHDLGGGEMTITTDEDMRRGPMTAEIGQEADQDHGMRCPGGALARAQDGGD